VTGYCRCADHQRRVHKDRQTDRQTQSSANSLQPEDNPSCCTKDAHFTIWHQHPSLTTRGCGVRSSGMLRGVRWQLVTDVYGYPLGPTFKDQALQGSRDSSVGTVTGLCTGRSGFRIPAEELRFCKTYVPGLGERNLLINVAQRPEREAGHSPCRG
jgi:hypothetical protein